MLDRNSPKPLYAQLEEILRAAIHNREWEPNHAIPSEIEMSRMYDISRMTVRAVVTQLVNEGLLTRVQGKGTFVTERKIPTKSLAYMGIREQLESMGYKTETKLIRFELREANARYANILGITIGDPIHDIVRVRSVDGCPISLHQSYIPRAVGPTLTEENLESEQLCVILQRQFGLKASIILETLESVSANEREAKLLEVDRNFPLLLLEDICKTAAGRIFEYTKVHFRGDKIKLHFEYEM